MADKPVARLVGEIGFNIDTRALDNFFAKMQQAEKQMRALGRQMDQLSKKSLTLKANLDTSGLAKSLAAIQGKMGIKATANPALDRTVAQQLRLEKMTAQARRETFRAELAQSKLTFANKREDVALTTAQTKQLQQQAILAAKQAQTRLSEARVQDFLTQAKTKQARLEAMLTTAQQKSAAAATVVMRQQTLLQRAQLNLNGAKEAERRREIAHQQRQVDRQARMSRAEQGQERQRERFRFAEERHTAWQARQVEMAERRAAGNVGGGGFGGMLGALGRSGLPMAGLIGGGALAGVQQILSYAAQRVEQRQQGADDAQQLSNVFAAAASQDIGQQAYIKNRFTAFSEKYGSEVSIDTAKDFRNFVLKQRGQGRTLDQALDLYEKQTATFRGAGMTSDESRRANLQLTQIRTKGYGDREDLNTFSEAAPILRGYVERAWAERNKFKGTDEQRSAAVTASTSKGNLKAADFNKAIEMYFAENTATIQRQAQSIQANRQRLENQKFLQEANINDNPELVNTVNENIKAHQELTAALEPLKTRLMEFDTALTSVMANSMKGAAKWVENPEFGPGGTAGPTTPTADQFVSLVGGDPKKLQERGQGEGLIYKVARWFSGERPQWVQDNDLGKSLSDPNAINGTAPTRSSDYKFDLKGAADFLDNEKKRQATMLSSNITNNKTNNITMGDTTITVELPNISAFDSSAVEPIVREIGQKLMQQREAEIYKGLSTDDTPR